MLAQIFWHIIRRFNLRILFRPHGLYTSYWEATTTDDHCLFKFGHPKYFKKVKLKVLGAALKLWYGLRRVWKIPYYSFSARIWNSPGTPDCLKDSLADPLKKAGITRWGELYKTGKLCNWDTLLEMTYGEISRFKYYQLASWAREQTEYTTDTSKLEEEMQKDPFQKEVSKWYWHLIQEKEDEFTTPDDIWKQTFPAQDLQLKWQVSCTFLWYVTVSAPLRKNHLFSLHRSYWTPEKLSKMSTQTTKLCPKCSEPKANDIHMFHLCVHLNIFWEEVGKVINKALGRDNKVSTF